MLSRLFHGDSGRECDPLQPHLLRPTVCTVVCPTISTAVCTVASTDHVDDSEVGDDPLYDAQAGVGQRALVDDLERPVTGDVLHQHDHLPGAVDTIPRAAPPLDPLARAHPFRDVPTPPELQPPGDRTP